MIASVGAVMTGSARSSTRTSPGACSTVERMVFLLGLVVVDAGGRSTLGQSRGSMLSWKLSPASPISSSPELTVPSGDQAGMGDAPGTFDGVDDGQRPTGCPVAD